MQRPRLIATTKVVERTRLIIDQDAQAKIEYNSFLQRTDTIFAMAFLAYEPSQAEPDIAVAAAVADLTRLRRPSVRAVEPEATPLSLMPRANAFEPRTAAADATGLIGDGLRPQALGFKPKGFEANEIAKAGLSRTQALGVAWLLSGNKIYAERGIQEMLALCALPHWGVQFLATAMIMQALAVGYDWLHGQMSEAERLTIRQALMAKGMLPGLAQFTQPSPPNWIKVPSNWNIVCNSSLILAALAIEPDEADPRIGQIKDHAFGSIHAGLKLFAPDGSWKLEGPSYWHLATEHLTYLLASLEGAADAGPDLSAMPGLAETGLFRCYMSGPASLLFNFGDSSEQRPGLWWMRWLGSRYNQPHLHEIAEDRTGLSGAAPEVHPMDLLWRRSTPESTSAASTVALPLSRVFAETAVLRGRWGDPAAAYLGIKGGETSGSRSHSHLDLGHFVYEVSGHRWVIDLGPDEYTDCYLAPPQRYQFYRAGTFGHNTLTLNGVNQTYATTGSSEPAVASVFGPLIETPQSTSVELDLSAAYPAAETVKRTFSLERTGDLTIVDEISPRTVVSDLVWCVHTRAAVSCDGRHARLTMQDETGVRELVLNVWMQGADGANFESDSAGPGAPLFVCKKRESSNPSVSRLMIKLKTVSSATRIMVRFSAPTG